MTFVPRASGIGGYFACDHRAKLDRMRADGKLDFEVKDSLNPYAAFGTVTHYVLQTALGCQFPTADAAAYAPSAEEIEVASQLFGGRPEAMHTHSKAVAGLAMEYVPGIDSTWFAEPAFEAFNLTGHIDFLSPDKKVLVDLKTAQRKPDHNRIKPGHLYQIMAYRKLLLMCTGSAPDTGYVLYVDAKGAKWALCLPFDFNSAQAKSLAGTVDKYLDYLLSPALMDLAVPRMGNTCQGDYCPYTPICRDAVIPPAGTVNLAGLEEVVPRMSEPF